MTVLGADMTRCRSDLNSLKSNQGNLKTELHIHFVHIFSLYECSEIKIRVRMQ